MFENVRTAFRIVFDDKRYIILAIFCSVLMGIFYTFSSQMITFFLGSVYFDFNAIRLVTLLLLSGLFGIVISMEIYFIKISIFRAREAGVAIGGVVAGMFALTCCAPVLPSLLVLFGVSGTFLLSTTAFFGKYLIYISLISIGLLLISIYILSRSLTSVCKTGIKRK